MNPKGFYIRVVPVGVPVGVPVVVHGCTEMHIGLHFVQCCKEVL